MFERAGSEEAVQGFPSIAQFPPPFPVSPGLGEAYGRWDDPLLFLPSLHKPPVSQNQPAPHVFCSPPLYLCVCVAHAKSQQMREHILIDPEFLQCHFLTELPLLARTLYVIGNHV